MPRLMDSKNSYMRIRCRSRDKLFPSARIEWNEYLLVPLGLEFSISRKCDMLD